MTASGVAPDIAFILQVRSARRDLFIEEFKEEAPAVLLTANLLASLQDDRLSGARSSSCVLKLFQHLCASESPGSYSPAFCARAILDMCATIALAKTLPGENVSLHRLIRLIVEGRAQLDDLIGMGLKSTADSEHFGLIRRCMAARQSWISAVAGPGSDEGDTGANEDDDDVIDTGPAPERDEEAAEDEEDDEGLDDEDEDEDEDDDDEEDAGDAPRASAPRVIDAFLVVFRQVLEAMYRDEDADLGSPQESLQLLTSRIRALGQYDPMRSRIPSMEEALELGRRAGAGASGEAVQRTLERAKVSARGIGGVSEIRVTAGTSGGVRASAGGGPSSATRKSPTSAITGSMPSSSAASLSFAAVAAAGAASRTTPQTGGSAGATAPASAASGGSDSAGARTPLSSGGAPATAATATGMAPTTDGESEDPDAEKLSVPRIRPDQITEITGRIGVLLGSLEQLDTRVWQVFVDPTAELADPCQFAEDLVTDSSTAQEAHKALRGVAKQQRIKAVISPLTDRRMNERRFDLEAEAFINTINNNRRDIDPDSRQLISLPKVLDYATAGLVRLEALRTALLLARESVDEFDPKEAARQYEQVLSEVTYLADRKIIEPTRQRADADAAAVGSALQAASFADWIVEEATDYVRQLDEEGHTESVESLSEAVEAAPLDFEEEEHTGGPGQSMPNRYTDPSKLGEVYDWARDYVLGKVWETLQPIHQPDELIQRLDEELRKALQGCIKLQPRRERHEKNPKVSLAVIGLDTLSGSPELADLFVRLGNDGKLLYLADFEDGTYIDLFELRKNTRRQMHVRAKGRAQDDSSSELQTGAEYLHTVGRTNTPIGRTPQEVMAGCILNEDGAARIYPV